MFKDEPKTSPLYEVRSITYRDNATLPICGSGFCTEENHTVFGTLSATECFAPLRSDLILGKVVLQAFSPYESQSLWLVIKVDTKELVKLGMHSKKLCQLVGDLIFNSKGGMPFQEVIVMGDDIDIFDFRKVFWAYVTRHIPVRSQLYFSDCKAFGLSPFISQTKVAPFISQNNDADQSEMIATPEALELIKQNKGASCVTNCLFPIQFTDFKKTFDDFEGYNEELKFKVKKNWKNYGY